MNSLSYSLGYSPDSLDPLELSQSTVFPFNKKKRPHLEDALPEVPISSLPRRYLVRLLKRLLQLLGLKPKERSVRIALESQSSSLSTPTPTSQHVSPSSPNSNSMTTERKSLASLLFSRRDTRPNLNTESPSSVQPTRKLTSPPRPKTLVLDLDETLIHSTTRAGPSGSGQDKKFKGLKFRMVEVSIDGRNMLYHVYKRPGCDFFLRKVSRWYTVIVFTASMKEYADPVIDWLDGGQNLIMGRYFRDSCSVEKGNYVKDLSRIEPDLSRVCLVDNSPASYARNEANAIPIPGWMSDPYDTSLIDLLPLLDSLRFTHDVRKVLGLRGFGIQSTDSRRTAMESVM